MGKIDKDTIMEYINRCYTRKYPINPQIQPDFWKAVAMLCENIDTDVSSLINEKKPCCVEKQRGRNVHFSSLNQQVSTLFELAQKIASEIIEEDSKLVEKVEIVALREQVKRLEQEIFFLKQDRTRIGL